MDMFPNGDPGDPKENSETARKLWGALLFSIGVTLFAIGFKGIRLDFVSFVGIIWTSLSVLAAALGFVLGAGGISLMFRRSQEG